MTLVVALAGQHEVVIGAERLCPLGDNEGQYGIGVSKVKLWSDLAFGFSGTRSGMMFFDSVIQEKPFMAGKSLQDRMVIFFDDIAERYTKFNCFDDIRIVACGVDNGEPIICTVALRAGGNNGIAHHTEGRVAIGLDKHGALHFLHTYH